MTYDPRHDQSFDELDYTDQRLLGKGVIGLGIMFLVVVGTIAVSHYFYNMPVHRKHGPGLASEFSIAFALLVFGLAGTSLVFAGLYILRRR